MDKTIEVLMVAVIGILAAAVLTILIAGESIEFMDWSEEESSGASCSVGEAQFRMYVDCDNTGTDAATEKAQETYEEYEDCAWAENNARFVRNSRICD